MSLALSAPRFEIKAVYPVEYTDTLLGILRTHARGFYNRYPSRKVNNIYFDSIDLDHFQENLSGRSSRRKLRYRWYGDDLCSGNGCMELKCKENGAVWKITQSLPSIRFAGVPWSSICSQIKPRLNPSLRLSFDQASVPTLINCYRRDYFETFDGSLRATVDREQRFYDQQKQSTPNLFFSTPLSEEIVLEMKAGLEHREEIIALAQDLPGFIIQRNSKYVNGICLS